MMRIQGVMMTMNNNMLFIVDLEKSANKVKARQAAPTKKATGTASTKAGQALGSKPTSSGTGLPEGGEWRTVRGAHVYIKDGKVMAGASGKLSAFDKQELTAIHAARVNKKDVGQVIFEGTEVKTGSERKTGIVKKITDKHYHVDYGDGKLRKLPKTETRRADAYKLKLEEKADRSADVKPISIEANMTPAKVAKQQKEREAVAAVSKTTEQHISDILSDETMRGTPVASLKAPLLKRDENGAPVRILAVKDDGTPDVDSYTGLQKLKYVTYEKPDATEEEVIKDHQGLIVNEIVNPYAKRYGLEYIQREWRDENGNPVDLYGDLVQTANIGFLHGIREYAHKTAQGNQPPVTLLTHGLQRSRDYVRRQAQDIFNAISLPEKLLSPLSAVAATEESMEKQLGHKPTVKEMVDGVKDIPGLKDNVVFNSLKMKSAPRYNTDKDGFDDGIDITDPYKKLEAVYAAKRLQKVSSLEGVTLNNDNSEDKELQLKDTIADDSPSVEAKKAADQEMKARNAELHAGVKKLLGGLLDERETKLVALRFGLGSKKRVGIADLSDVADAMGISIPLAKKISASAMNKLRSAPPEELENLKKVYMTKSLEGIDMLVKSIFVYDLQKSLEAFGLATEDLDTEFVRVSTGTEDDIKKSLGITEFIGSLVSVSGTDRVHARIVEYRLPEDLASVVPTIEKAFAKSDNPVVKNAAIQTYVKQNAARYTALGKTQTAAISHAAGARTWSEQLLIDNPGSAWITWHGTKILVHGSTGAIIYDSTNKSHREKYHPGVEQPEYPEAMPDTGHKAVEEEMEQLGQKWKTTAEANGATGAVTGGFIKEWRDAHKQDFAEAAKDKVKKVFPSGKFVMTNPYTGKRIAVEVELQNAGTTDATTSVVNAFDPDADEKVNIGNWKAIYKHLYDKDLEKGQNAYEVLMNKAHMPGRHQLEVLSDDDYSKLYTNTTEGAKANMVHKNFEDVTPATMKVKDPNSGQWKTIKYSGVRTYEADLGNGRVAHIGISENGEFSDPVMQQLINPSIPVNNANDLYKVMRDAVGNEVWVTLGASKMSNVNHHVKLKYDGQGAPVVVGGAFDGYRFQDAAEAATPEEKEHSLFKNGKPIRPGLKQTEKREVPFEIGNTARIRNPKDKRHWVDVRIIGTGKYGKGLVVELPPEQVDKGVTFSGGHNTLYLDNDSINKYLKHKLTKLNVATEMPVVDTVTNGMLNLSVPEGQRDNFEANYSIPLDAEGRANISLKQFMELRDAMGGASLTHAAKDYLEEYYSKQIRAGMPNVTQLLEKFNPNNMQGFKDNSFLKKTNFYSSQVEGIEHLLQAGKGVAGHGMGTGKTLLGVGAAMYMRNKALKDGKTPGKTLIVCPASIQNEWLKEINRHTNVGAVCITNNADSDGKVGDVSYSYDKNGDYLKKDGHRVIKEDLRSRAIGTTDYKPTHPEHFAVMSYDQFMENPDKFAQWASQNHYDNVIIDEVHAFKTSDGKRNAALMRVSQAFPQVWGLSGTPIDNEVTDVYNLVNAITGGKHDLGSKEEFNSTYLAKNGSKIVGMNESKLNELGSKLAKYVQFRNGYTDRIHYMDGDTGEQRTVKFPDVQAPNRYQGELAHVTDFDVQDHDGKQVNVPKLDTDHLQKFYGRYRELEAKYLSEAQRQAIENMNVEAGSKNYLQAVQRLQQYMNAPHSEEAYWEPKLNADGKATDGKNFVYKVDKDGYKRYFKATFGANGRPSGYALDDKGNKILLPPMHHDNIRAGKLKEVLYNHFAEIAKENQRRTQCNKALKPGETELPTLTPKVIVTSNYTNFGTDVIENVMRDLQKTTGYSYGSYTGGDAGALRAQSKVAFQQDPKMACMVISDAGKEGIDLGNAQMVVHYDHDFNPNLMAQKTARALRSDSWQHAKDLQRENAVKVVSLSMPGTVDDNIFRGQNRKMEAAEQVEMAVRKSEGQAAKSDYAPVYAGAPKKWMQRRKEQATAKAKIAGIPIVVKLWRRGNPS
jgi:SNF2 family DNA or RNA helicase/DNA-directed RNA polymerase specialized sigma subunit